MRKGFGLVIIFIFILLAVLLPSDASSDDAELEWVESLCIEGSCGSDNVRTHIQVNRTVVEILVNLSWVSEGGYTDLDMWIEDVGGDFVDTSSSTQIPELMRVKEFPNRGRWSIVVTPTPCGGCGSADFTMNITLRNIILPELDILPNKIQTGDKVNMSIDSAYENVSQYYFDFGDGTDSGWVTRSSISKTYNDSGKYHPKAKVRYSDGTESDWVEGDLIKAQADEEGPIFLWVLVWLAILESLIFLAVFLHSRGKGA